MCHAGKQVLVPFSRIRVKCGRIIAENREVLDVFPGHNGLHGPAVHVEKRFPLPAFRPMSDQPGKVFQCGSFLIGVSVLIL